MNRSIFKMVSAIMMSAVMIVTYCPVGFAATTRTTETNIETQIADTAQQTASETEKTDYKDDTDSGEICRSETMIYVNPMYRDIISESDIPKFDDDNYDTMEIDQSIKYYSTINEAGDAMISDLLESRESCRTGMVFPSYEDVKDCTSDICLTIMERAMRHTGNPVGGDYLRWQYKGFSGNTIFDGYGDDGKYYVTFEYKISFFTTDEQEEETTQAINSILDSLNLNGKTQVQKVSAIYDYMCKNIKYDYSGASNYSDCICHSAYSAAVLKKTVCQGYALLLYRMALTEGIDARVYVAYSESAGHSWNIVAINGKYYYLDATWDAGRTSYWYFLKGTKNFTSHSCYCDKGGPTESYSISAEDYTAVESTAVSLPSTSIKRYKAKKKGFTIYWNKSKNPNVEGYQIRYSRYSSFKKCSTKAFGNTSSGTRTGLKKKKKYYVQVRTYRKIPGTRSYQYSSWSSRKSLKTK